MKIRTLFLTVAMSMLFLTACTGMMNLVPPKLSPQDQELLSAVLRNDLNATTRLLQTGASPNSIAPSGNSILQTAVYSGHTDLVKLLLRNNGDPNLVSRDGLTALYLAKKPAMHKLLLENGADPFVRSHKRNYTPFESWVNTFAHVTTEAEKKKVMDTIKSQGIKMNREHFEQKEWLTRADLVETVKIYQSYKYDINKTTNIDKQTPLHIAAEEDKYNLMLILMDAGAKANSKDKYGDEPLFIVARQTQSKSGNDEFTAVVKALVKAGGDINGKDASDNTPLCNAAIVGNLARVNTLLGIKGIRVNERGEYGESAIFKTNVLAVSRALVSAGANVNQESDYGFTPLFAVVNPEVVTFLIKSGANINHLDKNKQNILVHNLVSANSEYRLTRDDKTIVELYLKKFEILIKAGIRVNEAPRPDMTALTLAKEVPLTKIVDLLVKSGAK
jgi:ankyrin repeat protein